MAVPFRGDLAAVRRAEVGPSLPSPTRFKVFKVTPGPRHVLRIVSSKVTACWVHVVGNRTLPCTGSGEDCWLSHSYELRKQRWLFIVESGQDRVMLCQLTEGALLEQPGLVNPTNDLRGARLELWRGGVEIRSAMHCKAVPDPAAAKALPSCPDIWAALYELWTADDRPENWQATNAALAAHLASQPVRQ